jgi:hypothetical protein
MATTILKKGDKIYHKSVVYIIYADAEPTTPNMYYMYKEGGNPDTDCILLDLSKEVWSHAHADATNAPTKQELEFEEMLKSKTQTSTGKEQGLELGKALEQIGANAKKKSTLEAYRENKMQKDSAPIDTPATRASVDTGAQYTQLLAAHSKHISTLLDMVKEEGELLRELAKQIKPNGKETTT